MCPLLYYFIVRSGKSSISIIFVGVVGLSQLTASRFEAIGNVSKDGVQGINSIRRRFCLMAQYVTSIEISVCN